VPGYLGLYNVQVDTTNDAHNHEVLLYFWVKNIKNNGVKYGPINMDYSTLYLTWSPK
jgi:hypothetical protein